MKALVTGCCGFIGSNLCKRLLNDGWNVLGIDMDNSDSAIKRIDSIKDKIEIIDDDINNIKKYKNQINNVDIVFHLAASSDILKSNEDSFCDIYNNILGTYQILELMTDLNIDKIVFSSTSVVYGVDSPKPTPEYGVDFDPISLYAASKCSVECLIRYYSHNYHIKSCIFRFGNVIGLHQHRGVIYDFLQKLKKNKNTLEILGDGKQIKSYVYIDDVIDAIITLPFNNDNLIDVYNLGLNDFKNVKELADIVCDELNIHTHYVFTGGKQGWKGDVPIVKLDNTKAISAGWIPKYNCEESIRKTVRDLIYEYELQISKTN